MILKRNALLKIFTLLFTTCLISCNSFFYYPDANMHFAPKKNGLIEPEEIVMETVDKLFITGWFFPGKLPIKGTVIQFHGNAQNMTSHYMHLYWLTQEGYNLFTFDYSGYGVSEGMPSPHQTVSDGLLALNKAFEKHEKSGQGKFIVYAESLGGIIALRALEDFDKTPDLLVLDSTFSSYKRMAKNRARANWLTWIFAPLVGLWTSDKMAPKLYEQKSLASTLFIHSKKDPVIPISEGQFLFEKTMAPKIFWELNRYGHLSTFRDKENRLKFLKFLETSKL